jgi:hypothetical protein
MDLRRNLSRKDEEDATPVDIMVAMGGIYLHV